MSRKLRGFTLIELLVVVAIIALLIAILLPSLAAAREREKTVGCSANMRSIGQICNLFGGEHDGHGPGGGGTDYTSGPKPFGVAWEDVLNLETMAQTATIPGNGSYNNPSTIYGIMELQEAPDYAGYIAKRKMLLCPNFVPVQSYQREFALNFDAAGGYTPKGALFPRYALPADARGGDPADPNFFDAGTYYLGAKLYLFKPGQILLIETEYEDLVRQGHASSAPGTGYYDASGNQITEFHNDPTGLISMNDSTVYPKYDGLSGEFSFRHANYKKGNFMYFDYHVEQMTPKDNIDSDAKFTMPGTVPGV